MQSKPPNQQNREFKLFAESSKALCKATTWVVVNASAGFQGRFDANICDAIPLTRLLSRTSLAPVILQKETEANGLQQTCGSCRSGWTTPELIEVRPYLQFIERKPRPSKGCYHPSMKHLDGVQTFQQRIRWLQGENSFELHSHIFKQLSILAFKLGGDTNITGWKVMHKQFCPLLDCRGSAFLSLSNIGGSHHALHLSSKDRAPNRGQLNTHRGASFPVGIYIQIDLNQTSRPRLNTKLRESVQGLILEETCQRTSFPGILELFGVHQPYSFCD